MRSMRTRWLSGSGVTASASASSAGPSSSVSGVRSSWLTLVKNAVLAASSSSSASARARSASYARALVMPVAIWLATRPRKPR